MPLLVIPFPAFDPVLVHLGPFAIRWYALAYIVGILLGWVYARALVRAESLWGGKPPLTVLDFDDFVVWVTLGIILGGRLGYVLFYNPSHFAAHPLEILQLWNGGMSFHGGFTGCVLAVVLFARKRSLPILSLGDITCAVGTIGVFLGRIANFINGELWGRATDASVPWAMIFPNDITHLPRHPSQLYEAGLEGIVLFFVLYFFARQERFRSKLGTLSAIFLIGYAVARMIGEQFREPEVTLPSDVTTWGQWLSLPMLILGIIFLLIAQLTSLWAAKTSKTTAKP